MYYDYMYNWQITWKNIILLGIDLRRRKRIETGRSHTFYMFCMKKNNRKRNALAIIINEINLIHYQGVSAMRNTSAYPH